MLVAKLKLRECDFGLGIAQQVASSTTEGQWLSIFYELLNKRQLSTAVRQMNLLLDDPNYVDLVTTAFRRMGLKHGG